MTEGDNPKTVPPRSVLNIGLDGIAEANLESLQRIFTIPESGDSTLAQIDAAISSNLDGFLHEHIVAIEKPLSEIETAFASAEIPQQPFYVSTYTDFILKQLVSQSVHTSAPGFVGHMTSALPYFMLPLAKIVTALNQNLVKVETSKAFTPMERQVLGMLHRLVYGESETFYDQWLHNARHALGAFCSGGTVANITALWAARNHRLGEQQIARKGLYGALQAAGLKGLAILVSKRGHYSLAKAVDLLGIGRDQLIAIDTDEYYRVDIEAMRAKAHDLKCDGIAVLGIVGLAGATETGSIDDLDALADLAQELGCHFHVDAAWGGATLFSQTYRSLLRGIERADSVTIDAHKQFYVPMGAGMVLFKDPERLSSIEHHAEYIIRQGSKDLGSHTLEGSRPGMALLVHAGLNIIGAKGYELLIDQGLEKARYFAAQVQQHPDFELVVAPVLNILGYRYVPGWLQSLLPTLPVESVSNINLLLDQITQWIQKSQRAAGKTFVSRTRVNAPRHQQQVVTVFRVVLANPLTTHDVLDSVLAEQLELINAPEVGLWMDQIRDLAES
ncbi:putative pyridoxal-dependent aspartate 1-decarboxylase [Aestuariicella hydrocarbonica]|uniref:Pyridoxal-dependent aspartate 1-decarboxylase n=1 Tax=Pseudomaricurvus hydrocarbonicus TaxID=1470433 RepID=A0A9E5JTR5_9GAMM|nr:putative pyridoxal-dependent aspartate 1-decarboxylase [Aestuariicella hydrocarbonica]NHO66389.1 putative pyridoxal-dependent aspartate 1-decarboxylase [Aestuariicella hydrocarbonica]